MKKISSQDILLINENHSLTFLHIKKNLKLGRVKELKFSNRIANIHSSPNGTVAVVDCKLNLKIFNVKLIDNSIVLDEIGNCRIGRYLFKSTEVQISGDNEGRFVFVEYQLEKVNMVELYDLNECHGLKLKNCYRSRFLFISILSVFLIFIKVLGLFLLGLIMLGDA